MGSLSNRITREQACKYAFDWGDEPLVRCKPGESVEIETYDASTGYFKSADDKAIPAKRLFQNRSFAVLRRLGFGDRRRLNRWRRLLSCTQTAISWNA